MTDDAYTSLLSNPAQDEALAAEARDYAREVNHAYGEIVRTGERAFSEFCEHRGVPEAICMRTMIQVALHRAGTNAAHLLAMQRADDLLVALEAEELAKRVKVVLQRQMPLSRETDARTEDTRGAG